jgi:hypothetical protein
MKRIGCCRVASWKERKKRNSLIISKQSYKGWCRSLPSRLLCLWQLVSTRIRTRPHVRWRTPWTVRLIPPSWCVSVTNIDFTTSHIMTWRCIFFQFISPTMCTSPTCSPTRIKLLRLLLFVTLPKKNSLCY